MYAFVVRFHDVRWAKKSCIRGRIIQPLAGAATHGFCSTISGARCDHSSGFHDLAIRLFVALDIDADIRQRIAAFRDRMRLLAPDVRWVGPQSLAHVTLQFLGETKKVDDIQRALRQ